MTENSRGLGKHMSMGALVLALFAVVASGLVVLIHDNTKDVIAENERQTLLNALHVLIPPERHDNDMYNDKLDVMSTTLSYRNAPFTVYRARKNGQPVAAILSVIAPDGYSGPISLLVAINWDGTLAGVRVVTHRETPGLGDYISQDRSDWIQKFDGRSLDDPEERRWAVKKDGGEFDQVTGATISPRAMVKAVYRALRYYRINRNLLFVENG